VSFNPLKGLLGGRDMGEDSLAAKAPYMSWPDPTALYVVARPVFAQPLRPLP